MIQTKDTRDIADLRESLVKVRDVLKETIDYIEKVERIAKQSQTAITGLKNESKQGSERLLKKILKLEDTVNQLRQRG